MRPTLIIGVVVAMMLSACAGDGSAGTTTTAPSPTTVLTTTTAPTTNGPTTGGPSTTLQTTTTVLPPPGNPWKELLVRVSAPGGWTVEPCRGDAPYLCVDHDGLTSHIELERSPLEASGFDALLEAAGAPPETTDLGAAAAHPAILGALRALAEGLYERYAEEMQSTFPDATAIFQSPVVVPVGRLNGIQFGSRIEDGNGEIIAWQVRYAAFDGETLWQITAEYDPLTEGGFSDVGTLLEFEPHITLMTRDLAVLPAQGTQATRLELRTVDDLDSAWRLSMFITYGDSVEQLGTTPGGEGGLWRLGPEFGAQAPDGTWWFVDGAKKRLAHYSAEGAFLDAAEVPAEYLIRGELFPWRLPHVLDDGTVVTINMEPGSTTLLLWRDGRFSTRRLAEPIGVKLDDGKALYGLTKAGATARIDPNTGEVRLVDWFQTRAGTRFNLWVAANVVSLWLPDAPTPNIRQLELTHGPDPGDRVYVSVEAAGGADGTLHLFLLGGTDSGAGGQLGGFLSISPDGTVSTIERTLGPDIAADPGSPAHLGVSPVTGWPWLIFVESDGVHVFERTR